MDSMWPVRDQVVETRVAELMWDVVRCVEGDKRGDVLEASYTLWKAEKELMGGLERGMLVPHRGSEQAFTLWDLLILKDELCTFKNYDALLRDGTEANVVCVVHQIPELE